MSETWNLEIETAWIDKLTKDLAKHAAKVLPKIMDRAANGTSTVYQQHVGYLDAFMLVYTRVATGKITTKEEFWAEIEAANDLGCGG